MTKDQYILKIIKNKYGGYKYHFNYFHGLKTPKMKKIDPPLAPFFMSDFSLVGVPTQPSHKTLPQLNPKK